MEAIGERLSGTGAGGDTLTLGGERVDLSGAPAARPEAAGQPDWAADILPGTHAAAFQRWLPALLVLDGGARALDPNGGGSLAESSRAVSGRDLLTGSSFLLSSAERGEDGGAGAAAAAAAAAAAGVWTAWGTVRATRFEGTEGDLSLEGDVLTGIAGVDWEREGDLAGVALSHSAGAGDFTAEQAADGTPPVAGEVETTLTAVHPYVRFKPRRGRGRLGRAGLRAWRDGAGGALGVGRLPCGDRRDHDHGGRGRAGRGPVAGGGRRLRACADGRCADGVG